MKRFTSLLMAGAIVGLAGGNAFAAGSDDATIYSCSFDFLSEGSETDPAPLELDDWDNIPEELIGKANYGFGGQGLMQAGGALYIPFEYNDDPDSPIPWYVEGLLWTPDIYEPMDVTIELDAKIAEGCDITTNNLWVYASDYVWNFDTDSSEITKDWSHVTLKIDATGFEAESEDDSYYFSIFVDGGADIVIKNVVIKGETATGVKTIEEDETETVYYNLNGQRILNPTKGTPVIKVKGSKATKVIL